MDDNTPFSGQPRSMEGLMSGAPPGFTCAEEPDGSAQVTYQVPHRGWRAGANLGCGSVALGLALLVMIFTVSSSNGQRFFNWMAAIFLLVGIVAGLRAAAVLLGKATFRFHGDTLFVTQKGLIRTTHHQIPRGEIDRIRQRMHVRRRGQPNMPYLTKDWSIEIDARRRVRVLNHAGEDQAAWLGRLLAGWAKVELEQKGPRWM